VLLWKGPKIVWAKPLPSPKGSSYQGASRCGDDLRQRIGALGGWRRMGRLTSRFLHLGKHTTPVVSRRADRSKDMSWLGWINVYLS